MKSVKRICTIIFIGGLVLLQQSLFAQQLSKADSIALAIEKPDSSALGTVDNREINAEFIGGLDKFRQFIIGGLVVDKSCEPGQRASFSFTIDKDGSVTDIKVVRSPFSAVMNSRIINMFKKSPKWKPAMQMGKPVRVQFTMPITPVE